MNVKFIGNGNITSKNFNACYLLNEHILIDAPAGLFKEMNRLEINLDDIDIIMITHMHGDHYFDMPFLLFNFYTRKREKPLILIGPKDLEKKVKKLTKLAFPFECGKILNELNITYIDADSVYNLNVGGINVSAVSIKQGALKYCHGYLFTVDNKTLGITGDVEMCPGLSYMLKNADVCITDVTNHPNTKHLQIEELKSLIQDKKITILPTHYPDSLKKELLELPNFKVINCDEQFFI